MKICKKNLVIFTKNTTLTSSNGTVLSSIPQKGDFDTNIEFETICETFDQILPATLILATYDSKKSLIAFKTQTLTEEIIENGSYTFHIDSCSKDISDLKIFVWNTMNGMMPLSKSYRVLNQQQVIGSD